MKVFIGIPVEVPSFAKALAAFDLSVPRLESHITLVAPTTIPDQEVTAWQQRSRTIIKTQPHFPIRIHEVDFITAFTLALMVEPVPELLALHEALRERGAAELDRAFKPHITLARSRNPLSPAAKRTINQTVTESLLPIAPFTAETVRLYGKHGQPDYEVLETVRLSGNS